MRTPILAAWLVLPLAAWAYHEGPGQERKKFDDVDVQLVKAEDALGDEDWAAVIESYEAALGKLPADDVVNARRIRLALNQARMMHKQLPVAQKELEALVTEMLEDPDADQALLDEARSALASAQYYITWLMRLEGYQREEWEPELEIARQNYRLLAERADAAGDETLAERHREDLEAAIKLARLEVEDLQGLPLPSQ